MLFGLASSSRLAGNQPECRPSSIAFTSRSWDRSDLPYLSFLPLLFSSIHFELGDTPFPRKLSSTGLKVRQGYNPKWSRFVPVFFFDLWSCLASLSRPSESRRSVFLSCIQEFRIQFHRNRHHDVKWIKDEKNPRKRDSVLLLCLSFLTALSRIGAPGLLHIENLNFSRLKSS